jgi:preprotein translocase subunit SecA
VNEYKQEGFHHFEGMLAKMREATVGQLMRVAIAPDQSGEELAQQMQPPEPPPLTMTHDTPEALGVSREEFELAQSVLAREGQTAVAEARSPMQVRKADGDVDPKDPATWGRPSRNQPCPCGSGKKFKHCHGKHE